MINAKKFFIVVLMPILFLFHSFADDLGQIPSDYSQFNLLSYREGSVGKDLSCPVDGKIIKQQKTKGKTTIVISCSHSYYWKGKEEICDYELIIYNIKDFKKSTEAKRGDIIGSISDDTVLLGRCKKADPYLILGSSFPAFLYKGVYYIQPGWLNQTTDTLSYRQVDSFEDCVNDYFARWESELENKDNVKGEERINSLFNYPELDSISFKMQLKELPKELSSYGSIGFISASYFGRNIWESFTLVDSKCKYTPVLCWQYNFKSYLEAEYKVGDDLYIYGTFLALDHMEKRIIFNVRDFVIRSEEEIYAERLGHIKEL